MAGKSVKTDTGAEGAGGAKTLQVRTTVGAVERWTALAESRGVTGDKLLVQLLDEAGAARFVEKHPDHKAAIETARAYADAVERVVQGLVTVADEARAHAKELDSKLGHAIADSERALDGRIKAEGRQFDLEKRLESATGRLEEADRAVGRARDAEAAQVRAERAQAVAEAAQAKAEAALSVAEARIGDLTKRAERAEQRVADLEAQLNAIVTASTR